MPSRPPRVCPRCKRLVPAGLRHRCGGESASPSSKITSTRRYRKMKKFYLAQHPMCEQIGCGYPAVEVDHIKPVHAYPELAYDAENLQSLCRAHHQLKTNADRRRGKGDDDDDGEFKASLPPGMA